MRMCKRSMPSKRWKIQRVLTPKFLGAHMPQLLAPCFHLLVSLRTSTLQCSTDAITASYPLTSGLSLRQGHQQGDHAAFASALSCQASSS